MKRKIVTYYESCSGCPFLKAESSVLIRWHCNKIDKYTTWFSSGEPMQNVYNILNEWFNNFCPLDKD